MPARTSFLRSALAGVMIQNPKHPQTNRLLAGWFRLRPKIIGLQLCDRLKDSHRFVSVFWILAKPIQYRWFGSQAPTAGRTTPATHNARISFWATFCDLAVKLPLALHCLPLVHCPCRRSKWHHGQITELCGAVDCVTWWHRSARRATISKRA